MTSPEQDARERYASLMYGASLEIVESVHDHGPARVLDAVDRALILQPPPGVDPVVALAVVLAAQVDPEATARARLGWLTTAKKLRPPRRPTDPDPAAERLDQQLADLDLGYSPENCRWATPSQQASNRRTFVHKIPRDPATGQFTFKESG